MKHFGALLIWALLGALVLVPLVLSIFSPLHQWRDFIYSAATYAGIAAFGLLLVQPLLARGLLPLLPKPRSRRLHGWVGALLVLTILAHVGGLYLTSPPDVMDALFFVSPTPFAPWGVLAMWAVFAAAVLALFRKRLRVKVWRVSHVVCVSITIIGTIVHAVLIEGTMEVISKWVLSITVALACFQMVLDLIAWLRRATKKSPSR